MLRIRIRIGKDPTLLAGAGTNRFHRDNVRDGSTEKCYSVSVNNQQKQVITL